MNAQTLILAQTSVKLSGSEAITKLKTGIGGLIAIILLIIFVKGILLLNHSLDQRKEGVEGAGNGLLVAALMIAGPLIITGLFALFWGDPGITVDMNSFGKPNG